MNWNRKNIENAFREAWPDTKDFKFWCQFHRICIAGSTISPPLFEMMEILGHDECLNRTIKAIKRL